jgi:hypothetical protein
MTAWIAPVIQAGGAVLGEMTAGGKEADARRMLEQALENFRGMEVPVLEELLAEQLGPSGMEGVRADPEAEAVQRAALAMLGEYTNGEGSIVDRAAMARVGNDASRVAARQRQAILNENAQRGTYGSGGELLAMMGAGQQATERAAQAGLDVGAQAAERRYRAIGDRAGLAGSMRNQQLSEDARRAAARDAVAQYNASARAQARAYNAQLPAQRFGMQMQKASAEAGGLGGLAQNSQQSADSQRQFIAGMSAAAAEQARLQQQQMRYEEERADRQRRDEELRRLATTRNPVFP